MKRNAILFLLIALALAGAGCRSETDRSEGTVLLTVSDFDGLPVQISTSAGPFSIDEIRLQSVAKDPSGTTSALMDIELKSYEVTYRRRDTGTRVPPSLVQGIFSVVPVNSTITLDNVPFMLTDQVLNPPLSDLRNFGVDRETNSRVVVLDVSMRFFGRTLSGDDIVSAPATFTIEVTP